MTFGENLRREREMRGVELREIADATKISFRFLQAIENDRADILPGGMFPQAFVRQYARYLGLDADKVVADFVYAHRGGPVAPEKNPATDSMAPDSAGGASIVPRAVAAAAVLLAAGGLLAWALRSSGEDKPALPAEVQSPPAVLQPSDRVYPPPSVAGSPAAAAGEGLVLTLQPRQSCWVKLQVDRLTVLNRTIQAGESQTFEAKREIVLNVGNAGGLAYTLNGRPGVVLGKEGEVKANIVITPETARTFWEAAPRPLPRTAPASAAPAPPPSTVVPAEG
jgi:cytoskeletal protein RodZ